MARANSNPNWKHILSQIDEDRKIGFCQECNKFVELHSTLEGGWRCQHSRNDSQNKRRRVNPDQRLKRGFRRSNKLLEQCEICGSKSRLQYDHNHKTKKFRGTLCHSCNAGLGFFKDNPEALIRASKYLLKRGSYHE